MRLDRFHPPLRSVLLALTACAGLTCALGVDAHAARAQEMMPSEPYPVPHGPDSASFRIHRFVSGVMGNVRYLRVFLPDGYDRPENANRRYPVLYLSDGQNLFEAMPVPHYSTWRVERTVRSLVQRGVIPPMIVVGIDNAGRKQRGPEYRPYPFPDPRWPGLAPPGRRYPDFLVHEVMPFINMTYRTLTDRSHTGLGGSSLGGLAAAYAMMAKPGVFGRILSESPSVYLDNDHIFRDVRYVSTWPERVYFGVGTNEPARPNCSGADSTSGLTREVLSFAALLRASGMDSSRVKVVVTPCGLHNEDTWAARLPEALTFLFGNERSAATR